MNNIIVPGQAQAPTYPQTNVQCTPAGVVFTISLGPTIIINHIVSHEDMEKIEAMRKAELAKFREMNEIAQNVMKNRL